MNLLARSSVLAVISGLCSASASADVLTVNIDGSADYTTIQAAIDASADGNTILLSPAVYYGRINMNGRQVTMRSTQGADLTILDAQGQQMLHQVTRGRGSEGVRRASPLPRESDTVRY